MKRHWHSFKQCRAMHIQYVHISKEPSCVFQPAFRMMRCFLIACELLTPRRWGASGAKSCGGSMTWVASIRLICIQSEASSVNKLSISCCPMHAVNLFLSGWFAYKMLPSGGKSAVSFGCVSHPWLLKAGWLRPIVLLVLLCWRVILLPITETQRRGLVQMYVYMLIASLSTARSVPVSAFHLKHLKK